MFTTPSNSIHSLYYHCLVFPLQNSNTNCNHVDGSVVSAHNTAAAAVSRGPYRHHIPPPQESNGSSAYPSQNTSQMSDQTINGDKLCEHIDDLFFNSDVV